MRSMLAQIGHIFALFCYTTIFVSGWKPQHFFYIYDWPDIATNYSWFQHNAMINDGAGALLDQERGIYDTWQFALYKLMYERALVDPRRTLDPMNATTFFIPYDFGLDACFRKDNGRMRKANCPLAELVAERLQNSIWFKRSFGHNHLLVVSVNQNINYFLDAKQCTYFLSKICPNCTKVAIDEYSFLHQHRKPIISSRGQFWHAVPFPSNVHMSSNVTSPPWTLETGSKSIIASFTGSRGSYNGVSQKLRHEIAANCDAYAGMVRDDNMTSCATAMYNSNQWSKELARNSLSAKSVFCFQPPGDMPTRKSVFDSVVLGCIPVFFNRLTAPLMYNWHLGQQLWGQISINFDHLADRLFHKKNWAGLDANSTIDPNRVDLVKLLLEMYDKDFESVRRRQKLIALHAHKLQYGMPERENTPPSPSISLAASLSQLIDGFSDFVHWNEETDAATPDRGRNKHGHASERVEKLGPHSAANRKAGLDANHNNAANSIFTELTKLSVGKPGTDIKEEGSLTYTGLSLTGSAAVEGASFGLMRGATPGTTGPQKPYPGGRHKIGGSGGSLRGKKAVASHPHRRIDAFDITIGNVLAMHAGLKSHNRTSHYMRCPGGKLAHYVDWCVSTNSTEDIREDW